MNIFKIITLAAVALLFTIHADGTNESGADSAKMESELENEIKSILEKEGVEKNSSKGSASELGGAEVRKKIDNMLRDIVEKYKTVKKSDPSSSFLPELLQIMLETYRISELFMASHQFLEAEKFIVSQEIDRIGVSIEHLEKTAQVQEAVAKLSGQPTSKKRKLDE